MKAIDDEYDERPGPSTDADDWPNSVDEDQNWYINPKILGYVEDMDQLFAEAAADYADIESGRL